MKEVEKNIEIELLQEICEEPDEVTTKSIENTQKDFKKRIKSTSVVIHHGKPKTEKISWDPEVVQLFQERFPNIDIYKMSIEELKQLYDEVEALREEYSLIELAYKLLSNGAYGASSSPNFYFYNLELAKDITGECRNLTKFFWNNLETFFHETIWERKDLWEKFGFELDESKHDKCRETTVSCYSDTDSVTGDTILHMTVKEIPIVTSIEDFYDFLINILEIKPEIDSNGKQIIPVPDFCKVQNWSKGKGLYYAPMKYLMCHPVKKDLYKITAKDGTTITTTGDHSVMVYEDGNIISVPSRELKVGDKLIINNK